MRRRSESGLATKVLSLREKLDRLHDLFAWLYDKSTDPTVIRRRFYPVLFRLTEGEVRRLDPETLDRFTEITAGWKWDQFRAGVRKRIEALISAAQTGKGFPLPHLRRSFLAFGDGAERAFATALSPHWKSHDGGLPDVLVLEAAEDLAGFRTDTIVQCSVCDALTIRQRARNKQYCSSACRWQAITDERRAQRAVKSGGQRRHGAPL